ncbi:MAG: MFS transporter [Eubacteriales bacterium]|nr:MFS transporter [Eubacteriales bacterium]
MKSGLWSRNFTILTLGTVISMLGNAVSGFAIGLMVLDYTHSTFLYALFMVVYSIPKIVIPLFAGPYLDRFSRRRMIYTLDFISSGIYLGLFFLIRQNLFHYGLFLVLTLFVGAIDSIYMVAYDSLYPNLISPGNYSKAYSVASMIYPLASFMVPVASLVYAQFGSVAPLFLFNTVTFFIAACFETQIRVDEPHIHTNSGLGFNFTRYREDFREGIRYIWAEKGLLVITVYFFVSAFSNAGAQTMLLPFFKNHPQMFPNLGIDMVTLYTLVTGLGLMGRLVGGGLHYRLKFPTGKKFAIALSVYFIITILDGIDLFLPLPMMMAGFFLAGIFAVTSYNIRIASTQAYVPDQKRARFNGVFQMVNAAGGILGQLSAGAAAEVLNERLVVLMWMSITLLAVLFVMYPGRHHVAKIYNREI